ncbi:uncharacterized protein PMUG01_07013300 [Plasmodium malariae]|uniref:Uncharacterized protein n=1 Tax=Plasmodium malariae TaxID=5858 RepID=A0A1D3JM97_PLAMA|nr:uncharacterized protein PMUG01_07013300 [Plasmodium malariae]SBT87671.1 hypothetical protein PMUG01_07013300 [Plasmodium malariae]
MYFEKPAYFKDRKLDILRLFHIFTRNEMPGEKHCEDLYVCHGQIFGLKEEQEKEIKHIKIQRTKETKKFIYLTTGNNVRYLIESHYYSSSENRQKLTKLVNSLKAVITNKRTINSVKPYGIYVPVPI